MLVSALKSQGSVVFENWHQEEGARLIIEGENIRILCVHGLAYGHKIYPSDLTWLKEEVIKSNKKTYIVTCYPFYTYPLLEKKGLGDYLLPEIANWKSTIYIDVPDGEDYFVIYKQKGLKTNPNSNIYRWFYERGVFDADTQFRWIVRMDDNRKIEQIECYHRKPNKTKVFKSPDKIEKLIKLINFSAH